MAIRQLTRANSQYELRHFVDTFLDDLAVRNRTDKTILFYQTNLKLFGWYAERELWPEALKDLTATHIRSFIRYLQTAESRWDSAHPRANRALTPAAVHAHYRTIRAFFNWLVAQEEIAVSPCAKVRPPKQASLIVPVFTEQQINSLLVCCRKDRRNGLRNEALILTLLDTGMRAMECCQLRLADVENGRARVVGKGRKERFIPLGRRATRAIRFYVARERPETEASEVFVSERGEPLKVDRLTHLVEGLGEKAAISGVRCSPHTLRHTFATTCLRSKHWTIYELMHAMGHSPRSLNVLQRYLSALGDDDVQAAHNQYSPADGMKLKVR